MRQHILQHGEPQGPHVRRQDLYAVTQFESTIITGWFPSGNVISLPSLKFCAVLACAPDGALWAAQGELAGTRLVRIDGVAVGKAGWKAEPEPEIKREIPKFKVSVC